ncbi:Aconitate hydratase precursor [Rubripirellula tenax]|uniref:Aconitate hydratase n=1 Tax=Rubripirellula tenax TaxID=2528015 RepID=A0A5C6EIX1_9BACT|nr:aconitate hydratase AcnA [Rubripirellula tenax]TWU47209.1 Aconitate hydratase precursor [Rubripirellula tenax]
MTFDPFGVRDSFDTGNGTATIYRLSKLEEAGLGEISKLPFSIRVLLEAVLRNCDGFSVTEDDVKNLAAWDAAAPAKQEVPFKPYRVVLQDFTGVPAVVDLAAMRSAMQRIGGDPEKINPLIPVDLVIDHSVQVDHFGTASALSQNVEIEFERNLERYEFLRWGQQAFDNFSVVPPNVGIVHQVNLEYLARVVALQDSPDGPVAIPDSLVGTDSHTTMINGLGVLGWGVGGIEAEANMLGQPLYMLMPEVIGFELTGALPAGATATDMVLRVVEVLREEGVVNKFVEFFGVGMNKMSVADRATIANMAPEYGATMGFFPVDDVTLAYMRQTGRTEAHVKLVETYCKEQGLFRTDDGPKLNYTKTLSLDLGTIEPSMAGPKRPQDRIALAGMKKAFNDSLTAPVGKSGFGLDKSELGKVADVKDNGHSSQITHGAVVIAAITSCTNTSNPSVMIGAGLLAKKAVARGLKVPAHVKTSLAPGSRVVTDYLNKAGVSESLDKLGFQTVGYGCTTCIGNSGPLPPAVANAIKTSDLVASAVLSGNRNFEGRVNPLTKANYLASPPLVVAYALAGTTDIDLATEPIGKGTDGSDVYLKDIWPSADEIRETIASSIHPEMFTREYGEAVKGNELWNAIDVATGAIYPWSDESTYIQHPPFLDAVTGQDVPDIQPIHGAKVLALLADSVTTDHISPAGAIASDGPAGKFLQDKNVPIREFNSFGSRRGNDRVMVRGTFANIRIRNQLAPGTEGGVTRYLPTNEVMSIYDASMKYQAAGTPLVVIAGAEYGTGSSRDWAAKGTMLLGVKAVITASYERIHRSNLVGMGVLPLEFADGATWQSLGLTGEETIDIPGLSNDLQPRSTIKVTATSPDGSVKTFPCVVRIDTPVEMQYYQNGGILPTVLRNLSK